jgi:hypothetical protein
MKVKRNKDGKIIYFVSHDYDYSIIRTVVLNDEGGFDYYNLIQYEDIGLSQSTISKIERAEQIFYYQYQIETGEYESEEIKEEYQKLMSEIVAEIRKCVGDDIEVRA